jgi:MFS transporter, YNFM family, putative membrane transport protein
MAPLAARPVLYLSLAAFVSAATLRAVDPLVPAIAGEYRTTPGAVGLTVTAFTLAYGACQLFWGPVGDRFGKYRAVALACLLSAATAGAAAFAGSLAALAGLRLLSGVTAAAIIPLSMAFIGDHVPYERRQATLAGFLSGQILGLVGGQVVGGVVGDLFGWRAVFLVLAALFLVPAFLLWAELRGGTLPPPVLGAPARPGQLAIAYLRLLRHRWARTVLLTVFAEGLLFFGAFAYAGAALHLRFGLPYAAIGALLATFGLGGLAYALNARRLVARLGERGLARAGGACIALGFLWLGVAPNAPLAAPAIFVLGLGFYMLHNTLQTNATQMAPEARGLAVSTFAGCFFVGQGVGAWLAGFVIDRAGPGPLFLAAAPALLLLAFAFARRLGLRPGA